MGHSNGGRIILHLLSQENCPLRCKKVVLMDAAGVPPVRPASYYVKVYSYKLARKLITHILNIQGGQFDYRDIDIQFRRNKPQNVLEIAQIITMLSGELSRETRLQMLPTIDNVQDELQKLEDEKQQEVNSFGQYNALAQALAQAKAQPEEAEASPEDEPEEKAGEGT